MKDYRFYAELPEDRGSKSASKHYCAFNRSFLELKADKGQHHNCIAVPLAEDGQPLWVPGTLKMGAYHTDSNLGNSPVAGGLIERGYLRARCVRISAELARKLHPRLFSYLEKP